jgi:hypothetical protein
MRVAEIPSLKKIYLKSHLVLPATFCPSDLHSFFYKGKVIPFLQVSRLPTDRLPPAGWMSGKVTHTTGGKVNSHICGTYSRHQQKTANIIQTKPTNW